MAKGEHPQMKRILLFLTLALTVMTAVAQEFGIHWIACPAADSTMQAWFRQTYITPQRPLRATVTVASAGNFELYVNRWNVSTDVLAPFRERGDRRVKAVTYDVSRYLRPDSNVIAVWYSPATTQPNRKQISVTYSGTMPNGTPFSHVSDPEWLCRPANRTITPDGGECVDGRAHNPLWNATEIETAGWVPALAVKEGRAEGYGVSASFYPAMRVARVHKPAYFDVCGDSVFYEFRNGFQGWIRITLRNAQRGEHIYINGLEYICNGNLDEQACRKFTITTCRRVLIYGDASFDRSQLYNVEGIEIAPSFHSSYQY